MRMFTRVSIALFLVVVSLTTLGCEEDPMRRGAVALGAENADEAEAAFQAALKADPANLEAKRLMADVHLLRGDFEKAEQALDGLWKEQGFGDEKADLSTEEKATKELMERQYRDLYKKWAEKLDAAADPDTFERVIGKGLEYDAKSTRLNTLAVNHYLERAKRLVEEGKKAEAADAYEKVLDFRATKSQREEAEKAATDLRSEAYADTFAKAFETAKPKLVESEMWDEEKGVAIVTVEADVDRSLRGNDPAQMKKAQQQAAKPFALALRQLVVDVAGLPQDADFAKAGVPENTLAESKLRRGKLTLVVHVKPEAIQETAFLVVEAKREADNAPDEKPDDAKTKESADAPDAGTKKADAAE